MNNMLMFLSKHRVLVLNSSFEAINICTAKRALKLLLMEKADVVEGGDDRVHSAKMNLPLPEVIRLRNFVHLPYRPIPYSRKNILLRDDFSCQYCGDRFTPDELTLDHVRPLSRGGSDDWNNVVAACKECNHKKGNHLPSEIGMRLIHRPQKPTLPTFLHLVRLMGGKRQVWRKYLFYDDGRSCEAVV